MAEPLEHYVVDCPQCQCWTYIRRSERASGRRDENGPIEPPFAAVALACGHSFTGRVAFDLISDASPVAATSDQIGQ